LGGQGIQGSFVLVIEDGQLRPVQVTVGLTAGDMTEVSGDLQEGDQVVVGFTTSAASGAGFFGGGGGFPGGGPGFFGGGPPP
jgi:multidrug efflux pump subunit AcrA (membrane-fusion protein)